MRIKTNVVEPIGPRTAGSVSKGEKKASNQFGKDLHQRLRFHGKKGSIAGAVVGKGYERYDDANVTILPDGDVVLDYLNIFAYSENPEQTFRTSMRAWGKQGLIRECDRQTISMELEQKKDMHGQPTGQMVKCRKQCPVADAPFSTACPKGCVQEGVLWFYIPELLGKGITSPITLTTKAWVDISESGIPAQLDAIAEMYGSISRSPFPLGEFGYRIPLILSRQKESIRRPLTDNKDKIQLEGRSVPRRTGGKTEGETWALSITVNPLWHQAFMAWQSVNNSRQLGYNPDPKLLIQAGIVVESEPIKTVDTIAIAPAKPEEDDWKVVAYKFGLESGLDSKVLEDMINNCESRESLKTQMALAIKQLRANQQPEIVPVTESVDSLLTESVDGEFFEEEEF